MLLEVPNQLDFPKQQNELAVIFLKKSFQVAQEQNHQESHLLAGRDTQCGLSYRGELGACKLTPPVRLSLTRSN